jgi:hypothetical protein
VVPVLRLGIHPEMERPAILNRSTPSIAGATMSIPVDLMMCPSSTFQRFVNLSMGLQFTCLRDSILDEKPFF